MIKPLLRGLVSVVLLFHLSLISLYPNALSRLQADLLPVFLPYANMFGLNSKWEFFAPDPEAASYLEYQIDGPDQTETFQYPPPKKGFFDFTYARRSTSRAYMILDPTALSSIFIPWVCRTHPAAVGVSVWPVYVLMPTLEEVRGGQPLYDPERTHNGAAVTLSCEEARHGS